MGQTSSQPLYGTIGQVKATQVKADFTKMSDDDIKAYCKKVTKDDPFQVLNCIKKSVALRSQETCETVDGVTKCTKVVASGLGEAFAPAPAPAPYFNESSGEEVATKGLVKTVGEVGVGLTKTVQGYVPEGATITVQAQAHGGPNWFLVFIVLFVALMGLESD